MRNLSPTLTAAVTATGQQPSIGCHLADAKEHWTFLRQDAPAKTTDGTAACVSGDGSLIRAALFDNGAGGNADLAVQRITNPATGAQWTTWTTLVAGACSANQPLAISVNPGNIVRLFYCDGPSLGQTIKVFESANNGATWTGPTTVLAGASPFFYLASAGNDDLFAQRNTAVGVWDVQFFKKTGGVWAAPITWTIGTFSTMSGIAAAWLNARYYLLVSLWQTAGVGIEAYMLDPAGPTWTDLNYCAPVNGSNTGLQFRLPAMNIIDGFLRSSHLQQDDGSIDGTNYELIRYTKSTATNGSDTLYGDGVHWSNEQPGCDRKLVLATGAPIVKAFGNYYLTTPTYTFWTKAYTGGDVTMNTDVSAAVTAFDRHESYLQDGRITVTIDDNNFAHSADPGLKRGAQITLNEGFVTSLGSELVTTHTGIIESIVWHRSAGENEIVIDAHDVGGHLDSESPILLTFTNRTVLFIVLALCTRARIYQIFWPGLASVGYNVPSFSMAAGQTFRHALHRILDFMSLEYIVRADQSLVIHDPTETPATAWVWSGEQYSHQIGAINAAATHVRAFGQKLTGTTQSQAEEWDFTNSGAIGIERYRQITDRMITSNAMADTKCVNDLKLEQRKAASGQLHGPNNPGLEVLDIVTIPADGTLAAATQRVHTIHTQFDVLKGEYTQTLNLMGA